MTVIPTRTVWVPMIDRTLGLRGDVEVDISVQCLSCIHMRWKQPITCDAFPEGIEAEILEGRYDHTSPYPGDNGIMYERAE